MPQRQRGLGSLPRACTCARTRAYTGTAAVCTHANDSTQIDDPPVGTQHQDSAFIDTDLNESVPYFSARPSALQTGLERKETRDRLSLMVADEHRVKRLEDVIHFTQVLAPSNDNLAADKDQQHCLERRRGVVSIHQT